MLEFQLFLDNLANRIEEDFPTDSSRLAVSQFATQYETVFPFDETMTNAERADSIRNIEPLGIHHFFLFYLCTNQFFTQFLK